MKTGNFIHMTTRLLFGLVVCVALALPSIGLAADDNDYLVDPIVHYKLEEDPTLTTDFLDAGPLGKTAACTSCPSTATGRVGEGLFFDGSGNIVEVAATGVADPLNIVVDSSVSVAAWVKRDNTNIAETEVIVGRSATGGGMQIWLGIKKDSGAPAFSLRTVSADEVQIDANVSIADGQWHLVAGVYDADNAQMLIYVDGVVAGATDPALAPVSFGAGFSSNDAELVIGALSTSKNFPFNGVIDEVAFFKLPLTAEALASNFAAGNQNKDYDDLLDAVIQPALSGTGIVGYPFSRQLSVTANPLPASDDFSLPTAPAGMTVVQDSGLISWTPTSEQKGENLVSVAGNSSSAADFVVTVDDVCGSGTASYWRFEDDAPSFGDTIPNNQTVTCSDCPITAVAGGAVGKALTFNGTTTFLKVDPDPSAHFDLALGQSFSLAAWVKREDTMSPDKPEVIVARDTGLGFWQFWLGLEGNGAPAFQLTADSSSENSPRVTADAGIADGQWHHVVGVYDAVMGQLRIYVDGLEAANPAPANFTTGFASDTEPLVIGALNAVPRFLYAGDIDEVAFIKEAFDEGMAAQMVQNSGADKAYFCQSAPEITSGAADATIDAGATFSYTATAIDAEDSDLFWELFNAPAGMSVDSDGVVTWAPTGGVLTSGLVTLRVDDNFGGSDSINFTVTVAGAGNQAPTITDQTSAVITIMVDGTREILLADLVVSDPENDTIQLDTVADGDNYSVNGFIVTPDAGYEGNLTIPVTVTDGTNISNVYNVQAVVQDFGITSTASTSINAGETFSYSPTTSRPQATLVWELRNQPAGMSVDGATGTVTWTPAADVTTSGAVTLTVTDFADNAIAMENFTITVIADPSTNPGGGGGGGGGGCFIDTTTSTSGGAFGLLMAGLLGIVALVRQNV